MPNNVSTGFDRGYIDMSKAPGSDTSFDDLFPVEGEPPAAAVPQPPAQGTNPPQPPQAPQPFLKAGDSVYNTAEDAINGTVHKDTLIARYRTYLQEQGIDPNELKPIERQEPQAPAPQTTGPQYKYLNNGKKYYGDLEAAVKVRDMESYERINREYQNEVMDSRLAPYLPIMAESQRQRAIRVVSQELPNFQTFLESQAYKDTLKSMPLFGDMVGYAERDPNLADKLPQVYKAIYLAHQGMNPPAQVPTVQTPSPTNPTGRQGTMIPSSLTPPPPGVDTRGNNWTLSQGQGRQQTSAARTQLIEDGKARGIDGVDWSSLGL